VASINSEPEKYDDAKTESEILELMTADENDKNNVDVSADTPVDQNEEEQNETGDTEVNTSDNIPAENEHQSAQPQKCSVVVKGRPCKFAAKTGGKCHIHSSKQ
jgi:hypothetical protein